MEVELTNFSLAPHPLLPLPPTPLFHPEFVEGLGEGGGGEGRCLLLSCRAQAPLSAPRLLTFRSIELKIWGARDLFLRFYALALARGFY